LDHSFFYWDLTSWTWKICWNCFFSKFKVSKFYSHANITNGWKMPCRRTIKDFRGRSDSCASPTRSHEWFSRRLSLRVPLTRAKRDLNNVDLLSEAICDSYCSFIPILCLKLTSFSFKLKLFLVI
jgi:hypothetical protein